LDYSADFKFLQPFIPHQASAFVQDHFAAIDVAEQAHPFMRAYRNEIRTGLGIIVTLKTDAATVVNGIIVRHIHP
jgi:hypothetical protein